jgi:hypothetical protein
MSNASQSTETVRFRTTVHQSGKTTTGIIVPPEVIERLGSGKRPAVKVGIGEYSYRSTIASMGGQYMISLSAENRAGAGVAAGDEIDVELELDSQPREIEVPEDLAEALAGDAVARQFFEGLSYSKKLWFVLQVTGAKTGETRQRRVEKVFGMLQEGRTA